MTRRPAPKGWCPSSLRPMESGDGYIVRIKPAFGRVTRAQLEKITHLADQFGNGIIELTNRANLQLRGVTMADHPALIDALVQAELADMDPDLDAAPKSLSRQIAMRIFATFTTICALQNCPPCLPNSAWFWNRAVKC